MLRTSIRKSQDLNIPAPTGSSWAPPIGGPGFRVTSGQNYEPKSAALRVTVRTSHTTTVVAFPRLKQGSSRM